MFGEILCYIVRASWILTQNIGAANVLARSHVPVKVIFTKVANVSYPTCTCRSRARQNDKLVDKLPPSKFLFG